MAQNRSLWLAALVTFSFPALAPRKAATPADAAHADQNVAGEITGKVTFEGTPPKATPIIMAKDPVCSASHDEPVYPEDGAVNSNSTLPNVFIYVKEGAEKYNFTVPGEPVTLDQRGCMYRPHVLGIMAGQELRVVSSDPTTHNIHPLPKNNREWNQSQPPGAAPLVKKFARPEIMIPVKCNQHPWMRAYIGVTTNPFYAVTGNDGAFTVKGLPPGEYTLAAWTATFGTQTQKVTIKPGESTTVNFIFKAS